MLLYSVYISYIYIIMLRVCGDVCVCVYSDVTKYLIEVKQVKGIDEEMLPCYQNTLETVVVKPTL